MRRLEKVGSRVSIANDGLQAVAMYKTTPESFDIVSCRQGKGRGEKGEGVEGKGRGGGRGREGRGEGEKDVDIGRY